MRYYVDINVLNSGDGSKEKPFKNIQEAANIAIAGDEVFVAPDTYREYVSPMNTSKILM